MTEQEQIDLIAEKIMGWHKSEVTRHLWWISTEGHLTYRIRDYNPYINIQQAIDVLDIFCKKNTFQRSLVWTGESYICQIFTYNEEKHEYLIYASKHSEDEARAICLALIEVIGGEKG